jgi:hypothetical protein
VVGEGAARGVTAAAERAAGGERALDRQPGRPPAHSSDRRCANLPTRRTINVVTEEESEEMLGPVITALVATIPTPPNTPEQVDLLIHLLTGSDLQQL